MNKDEKLKTINFFKKKLEKYGNSPKASDWGSDESQIQRFEILVNYFNIEEKKILDVGCGLGNFNGLLDKKGIKCHYTGYDIVPEVIEIAKKKYPNANFEVKDIINDEIIDKFDYVFLSGAFNYKIDSHQKWIESMIKKMYEISIRGIGFNVLSLYADYVDNDYYYADPSKVLDFCFTLTRNICLKHDYMPHDFTIFMKKDEL